MHTVARENARLYSLMNTLLHNTFVTFSIGILILKLKKRRRRMNYDDRKFTILDRIPAQMKNMSDLCEVSDEDCRDQLRMGRAAFHKLCFILQSVCGLKPYRRVSVPKKVDIVKALSRNVKLCVEDACYVLGQASTRERGHDRSTLAIIPGLLGSCRRNLYDVHVPITEKGRYRNQKGQISINVLCSAVDSRVLRDAINRDNGLKVLRGNYYICDNEYANCEGFLTPYKGLRYYLNEWTSRRP
ncbi:hypothetical protein ACS0TY_003609 [Phlomoides rotata]